LDKLTILKAATSLAETRGYSYVYKRHIAATLGCGMGTVNYHWGTMTELRTAIVQRAVETKNKRIVLQALAANHHAIRHLTAEQRAFAYE
jgi:AcrR family transcriptional regulator